MIFMLNLSEHELYSNHNAKMATIIKQPSLLSRIIRYYSVNFFTFNEHLKCHAERS